MNNQRSPIKAYVAIIVVAPLLFVAGMVLYHSEVILGEQVKVEEAGAVGLAANLSLMGLTTLVRLIVSLGPHMLILIGLGLPVVGALLTVDRMDTPKYKAWYRRRIALWALACGETFAMLALFVFVMETYVA